MLQLGLLLLLLPALEQLSQPSSESFSHCRRASENGGHWEGTAGKSKPTGKEAERIGGEPYVHGRKNPQKREKQESEKRERQFSPC